jgi:RNA polymerase sigma-70 factor (ECF subfamily)
VEPSQAPPDASLEQAFRLYQGLVYRAAYRITGSAGDAEDVLQSVFLRLLQRGPESEPVARLESYLYRAAVNTALDLMRLRQTARTVPLEEVAAGLAESSSLAPDRAHEAGEIRDWLRRALTRLSPMAAEIFVLRFFEGKENPEIARLLGTTPGTVAVTLHRSRERIEKELEAYLGGKR